MAGMAADIDKRKIMRGWEEGSTATPEEIGVRLAQKLVDMGAEELIAGAGKDEGW